MTRIFVSYASKDRQFVARLVAELKNEGHEVWWDRAIQPGQRFDRTIDAALNSAQAVITVWSIFSVESDWVRWESNEALLSNRLLPVRIDGAHLPPEFQRTQTLDLRRFAAGEPDPDQELRRLLEAITLLSESRPIDGQAKKPASDDTPFDAARELSDEPSIAVMPFRNQSNDEEYDYFADGISEDLVHALSMWRSFPVISYASTVPYKGKEFTVDEVASNLGVKYLVTGVVRRAGQRIRVYAELTETSTKRQIWRQRWTGELTDFFDLQEEISAWIASHIQPRLIAEAREAATRKRPADMNAWDLGLRAHVEWTKHSKETNRRARDLAERALELDPASAFAAVTIAETHYHDIFYRYTDDILGSIVRYAEAASRALSLAPEDANANVQKGMSHMLMQQRDQAIKYLNTAVELNPYFPLARQMLGQLLILGGEPEEGIDHLLEGLKYSPNHESIWADHGALALGYYVARHYAESISQAEICTSVRPQFPLSWAVAAASAYADNDRDRARSFVNQMLQHCPEVSKHELLFVWMGSSEELRSRFISDLRGAGYDIGEPNLQP